MNIFILLISIILSNLNGTASESSFSESCTGINSSPASQKKRVFYVNSNNDNQAQKIENKNVLDTIKDIEEKYSVLLGKSLVKNEAYENMQSIYQKSLLKNKVLDEENKNLQAEKEKLGKELGQKNKAYDGIQRQLSFANLRVKIKNNTLKRQKDKNKRLQENLNKTQEENGTLQQELASVREEANNRKTKLKHSLEKLELSRKFNIVGGIVVFAVCLGGMDRLFQTIIRPKLEKFLYKNTAGSGLSEKQVQFKLQIGRIIWDSVSGLIIGCAEVLVFSKYLSYKELELID